MNLKRIKAISTKWSLNKKAQNITDLVDIEFELKIFHDSHLSGNLSVVDKDLLIEIESRKHAILLFREKEARQKSRALWLRCGDDNTPFFHKFAAHRKCHNSIWKLYDDSGNLVEGSEAIVEARIQHFESLFKEEADLHLPEIVHSAGHFPSSISEDENDELMQAINLTDIKHILSISKNYKSPGPDGIPVEVYRCMFDVLGEDL